MVVIAIVRLLPHSPAFRRAVAFPSPRRKAAPFVVVCLGRLGLGASVTIVQRDTTSLVAGAALSRTRPKHARSLRPTCCQAMRDRPGSTPVLRVFSHMSAQVPQAKIQMPAGDVRLVPIVLQKSKNATQVGKQG